MATAIIASSPTGTVALNSRTIALVGASLSAATIRAYRSDLRVFTTWCKVEGARALPASPETVAAFIGAEVDAGVKASTLSRRMAAISYAHDAAGLTRPTATKLVTATMRGARRMIGTAQKGKAPATADRVAAMLATCPETLIGLRDRALLALGFAGAFRRSELVALTLEDLEMAEGGARITVRRSKTDQTGAGHVIGVLNGTRLRPLDAVAAWCDAVGITSGPIFRRVLKGGRVGGRLAADYVADVVKTAALAAGLNPVDFSGHSLRAGFITSGAEAGVDALKLAEVSRHKSLDVLRGYVRRADLLKNHAGASFM